MCVCVCKILCKTKHVSLLCCCGGGLVVKNRFAGLFSHSVCLVTGPGSFCPSLVSAAFSEYLNCDSERAQVAGEIGMEISAGRKPDRRLAGRAG